MVHSRFPPPVNECAVSEAERGFWSNQLHCSYHTRTPSAVSPPVNNHVYRRLQRQSHCREQERGHKGPSAGTCCLRWGAARTVTGPKGPGTGFTGDKVRDVISSGKQMCKECVVIFNEMEGKSLGKPVTWTGLFNGSFWWHVERQLQEGQGQKQEKQRVAISTVRASMNGGLDQALAEEREKRSSTWTTFLGCSLKNFLMDRLWCLMKRGKDEPTDCAPHSRGWAEGKAVLLGTSGAPTWADKCQAPTQMETAKGIGHRTLERRVRNAMCFRFHVGF